MLSAEDFKTTGTVITDDYQQSGFLIPLTVNALSEAGLQCNLAVQDQMEESSICSEPERETAFFTSNK